MRRRWLIEKPFTFGVMTAVMSVLIGIPWGKTLEQQAWNVVLGFAAGVLTSCLILLIKWMVSRRGLKAVELPAPVPTYAVEPTPGRDVDRRPFEPFCDCPRCDLAAFHVFSPPHEKVDSYPEWVAGPGNRWIEEEFDEDRSVQQGRGVQGPPPRGGVDGDEGRHGHRGGPGVPVV